MEERWDSVDEAGNISKYEDKNFPNLSCQQISEHKGTEKEEEEGEFLLDKTSNSMAAFDVKTDAKSAQFLGSHSYSELMTLDVQKELNERRETVVMQDKCPPFSKELCPMGQTTVQENCKDSGKGNVPVEGSTIVYLSSFSSCLPEKRRNVIQSPTGLESQQSASSNSSQSDHAQYVSEVVDEKPDAAVSHHSLPCAETEKGDEKLSFKSLSPVIEKQQKRKTGRPYKKRTQLKMSKRFAIAQHWDSATTEIDTATDDTLTMSDEQKKCREMQECPPSTGRLECNVKFDSSNLITTPILHSDGIISTSKIDGPSISVELKQPSRRKRTFKTIPKKEVSEEVSEVKLITATKEQDTFIEKAVTQNTLVPFENFSSIKNSTESAVIPQNRRGKKKGMAFKARNRRKLMLNRNKIILSCHTTTQSQSSTVHPEENNCCGFSQDVTSLQSSNIKLEPKDLSGASVLDVNYNLKNPQRGESPSKCFIEVGVKTPGTMSKCINISITQKGQGATSDMREMQDNVITDVSSFGNQVEMSTKTSKLLQLKNIEDMLKLKRKAGRPYKKKTLFKMAKLLAITQECVSNDTENIDMREENVLNFQQEVNVCPTLKSEVKMEETNTKVCVINSPQSPSRQSQRTCETSQNTVQTQEFTQTFIQQVSPVPSDLIEPILKSEETSLIFPVNSPICIKSNQNRTTSVSHLLTLPSDSMTPAKIVSTENEQKDINIKLPYTSIVSQLFTNGISLENVNIQDNIDEKNSRTSVPNVLNPCQSEKHKVQDKKVKEKAVVPLSESTALSVSDYPLPLQNPSTSQNQSLLKSKNKTETKTAYMTSRVVRKTNSKLCKSRKKTLQNIKKTQVPTSDYLLGEKLRPSDLSQINQMRQVEAVIESVIEDVHKPLEDVEERNKINAEDINVSESSLDNLIGAELRSLEVEHVDPMRQVEAVIESVIQNNCKPLVRVIRRKCMKEVDSNVSESVLDPRVGVDHRTLDMPQVDHIRQIESVIDSVVEDHKKEVCNVHASEKSNFPLSDNQLEHKKCTLSASLLLQSDVKQESPKIKTAIVKTATENKSKKCRKNPQKASMPTFGSIKNSKTCKGKKLPLQKHKKPQMPNLESSLGVKQKSPNISQMDQWKEVEALIDYVNEDLDKMLEHQEQQKKIEQLKQVEAVIESVIENIHKPLNPTCQKRKIKKETNNDDPLEEITFPNMDELLKLHNPSPVAQNDLQSRKPKSTSKHVIPKMSIKRKSKVCSKLPFYKNPRKVSVLTSDSFIEAKDGCHEMSSYQTKAEKVRKGYSLKVEKEAVAQKPHQCKQFIKKLKEDKNGFPSEPKTLPALDDKEMTHPRTLLHPYLMSTRQTKSPLTNPIPERSTKMKSNVCRKVPSKTLLEYYKRETVLHLDSPIGGKHACLEMSTDFTDAQKIKFDEKSSIDLVKPEKEAATSMAGDNLETATHKPRQCKGPRKKLKKEDMGAFKLEPEDSTTSDSQVKPHELCVLQQVSLQAPETKTDSGMENTTSKMATTNKTRKSKNRKLPSKILSGKPKRAAIRTFKLEQEESTTSDSQVKPHELCVLQQVSLQAPETKTDSVMENTTSKMATTNKTQKSKKRRLPLKALSGKSKIAAFRTTNSTLGAEVEMPSHPTYAEQSGKSDKKTVDIVIKDEELTLGMENNMETAHKQQCVESKYNLKKEACIVSISEETATPKHSALQQESLIKTEVKTESAIATQKNIISKACKKRMQNFKQTTNTTKFPPPQCSILSVEVEDRNSDMASIFPHVQQVQNIVDNTKGSKLRNENTEASHPIINVRNSRRLSRSNSDVNTDLIQDQPVLSVTSDLTNHLTSSVSTTVSSIAAQGQIAELVSADHTQKTPNIIRSSTKILIQRPKRSGALYKNNTDGDREFVKVVSTLLKDESPENRAIEKKRKGKKGKILKTVNLNPPRKRPFNLKNGIATAEDSFILEAHIDEAGVTASTAVEEISIGTQRKGLCSAKGKKQKTIPSILKVPSDQPCMGNRTDSLCVNSIPQQHGIRKGNRSSSDLINANINIPNHRNYLSNRFEFLDSSLPVNRRVKNNGKKESKTIAEELTVDTAVVKEIAGLDFPTTIAGLKMRKSHAFKKITVKTKSSGQKNSNIVGRHSMSQKQSFKSVRTSKRGKINYLNPMATSSRRHTSTSKAMQLEDIVLKQEQNDTWDNDVSSNISSPQIATDSHCIVMNELDSSQSSKTMLSVNAEMLQVKSIPLTTSVTKQSHKVTGVRKRRRANKTGWATKVKSKRPLSLNRNTLVVSVQSSTDNSGLFNSLTENDTLESVKQEKECRGVTNSYNLDNVEINPRHQHLSACAKFQTFNVLQNNLKTRKPMSCHFCGQAFRHISAYTIHKRIHTGEKPYRCQKCGKRFAQLSKLNTHLNTHKQHGPMQCPCCVTKSPNKNDLIDHFKIHLKGARRFNLNNRTREIQIQPYIDYIDSPVYVNGKKSFRCSNCFKDFFNKATLKMHLQTHCGVRGFTCKICSKKFSKLSNFNAHEKTHWPVKPYACSVCGKCFVLLRELKTHSNMHSGEMPFFCSHCGQSFSKFSSLRSHQFSKVCFDASEVGSGKNIDIEGFLVEQRADMLISTPMYFKCQICKQLYHQWCQYILHLQTHTNNKPNLCEICGQRYDQQVSELCVHCKVCCKSSGEERACNSALSEVWHGPQPIQDQITEPDSDSLYKDPQETSSSDHQHPQCKEPEPLQSLETMEDNSSDLQNPNPAGQFPGNGLEVDPYSPSNSICASPGLSSFSAKRCNSECVIHHPSVFHSRLQTHATCDRYSCRQCGKSFNQWNKLWLHQRLHKDKRCIFSCIQCNLEFRFLGSYREHLQEHAAQSPFACPLCPKTYIIEEDLNAHLCKNHQPIKTLTCDTCGKGFTSSGNLERHRLLHRGAISHYCVPCSLLFPSNQALQNHLKSHIDRPGIPLPKGQLEPLIFPYHCRKCNARFTTTDLLQAHQVCHLTMGKNRHSSSANIISASLTSKLSNKPGLRDTQLSTQKIPCLPLSKKKHLYRYPHPDRLYVVPKISSQPPVIISDTEEDCQEIIRYGSSSFSHENERQTSTENSNSESSNSDLPQTSSPISCVLIHGPAQTIPKPQEDTTHIPIPNTSLQCQGPKIVPTQRQANSKVDDNAFFQASKSVVISRGNNQQFYGFECADCLVTFCDISDLHEHYLHHARGVK